MRHIKNSWVWLLILGIGGVAVIWSLHVRFPDALSSRDGKIDLAHSLLILTFVGAGFIMFRRQTINKMVKNSLIWITLAGLLFVGYSFRNELGFLGNRLLGDLVPTLGQKQGTAMRYPSSANGHFMVEAKIETDNTITRARMLIDTGATDVLINLTDSKRLGFNIDNLKFTKIYHTANGRAYGAPIILDAITLGSIRIENVRASIINAELGQSLLGMSYLERLSGYEVQSGSLILYP